MSKWCQNQIAGAAIGFAGLAFVADQSWSIALGIFLMLWGNNIQHTGE